jgi:predicted esterase
MGPVLDAVESRNAMTHALALALALVAQAGAAASPPPLVPAPPPPRATVTTLVLARKELDSARQELIAHFSAIDQRSSSAVMIETRLDEDFGALNDIPASRSITPEEYAQAMALEADMTAALIHQLATGQYHPWSSVHGLDEVVARSPADGTMQPAAIYVPQSYRADKAAPLVILLHGRTQSEMDILAVKWFRELADANGAIIVAPYGRGDSQYVEPAPQDIYATLDAAKAAFNVDPRRTFLAGYSMGGYGVYSVGPQRAGDWAGFLAIAGGPTSDDEQAVFASFAGKPVYMVSGVEDDVIPNSYVRLAARVLRERGIPTGYYEQPGGTHSLATIYPAIARAWSDMLRGIRPGGVVPAPGPIPAQPMHPD